MDSKWFADLTWSKKLAKYFPDAEWWWVEWNKPHSIPGLSEKRDAFHSNKTIEEVSIYPALHTDMLLEKLPTKIHKHKLEFWLSILKIDTPEENSDYYTVGYSADLIVGGLKILRSENNKKLPNALSAMLYWLDQEGLVK